MFTKISTLLFVVALILSACVSSPASKPDETIVKDEAPTQEQPAQVSAAAPLSPTPIPDNSVLVFMYKDLDRRVGGDNLEFVAKEYQGEVVWDCKGKVVRIGNTVLPIGPILGLLERGHPPIFADPEIAGVMPSGFTFGRNQLYKYEIQGRIMAEPCPSLKQAALEGIIFEKDNFFDEGILVIQRRFISEIGHIGEDYPWNKEGGQYIQIGEPTNFPPLNCGEETYPPRLQIDDLYNVISSGQDQYYLETLSTGDSLPVWDAGPAKIVEVYQADADWDWWAVAEVPEGCSLAW